MKEESGTIKFLYDNFYAAILIGVGLLFLSGEVQPLLLGMITIGAGVFIFLTICFRIVVSNYKAEGEEQ